MIELSPTYEELMLAAAAPQAKYFVRTWDYEAQDYTPQEGVSEGPYTLMGLRMPLRQLRRMGYSVHRPSSHDIEVWKNNN